MARRQRKAYLLRWNPNISTYTRTRFENDMSTYFKKGTEPKDMNWNVYEYQKVRPRDFYFTAQVGCEVNGIVWGGLVKGELYDMIDDNGKLISPNHRWIDLEYIFMQRIEKKLLLTADKLSKIVPKIDWEKGHSGILLTPGTAEKLALAIGNELLHAEDDENLVFDSFCGKEDVISSSVGYLCPKLKKSLLEKNRVDEEVKKDLKKGEKIAITDLSVRYDVKDVKPDTKLEDILYVTKIGLDF